MENIFILGKSSRKHKTILIAPKNNYPISIVIYNDYKLSCIKKLALVRFILRPVSVLFYAWHFKVIVYASRNGTNHFWRNQNFFSEGSFSDVFSRCSIRLYFITYTILYYSIYIYIYILVYFIKYMHLKKIALRTLRTF